MKCSTPYCLNQRAKYREICYTCHSRNYRKRHPDKSAYRNARNNAKRRGIPFTISFRYYLIYWKPGMTIDRKDETKGYVPGNLQTVTLEYNVWKENFIESKRKKTQPQIDIPF